MIQRVQSLYLAIAFFLLCSLLFGLTIYKFVTSSASAVFTAYGVVEYGESTENRVESISSLPMYIGVIALSLLIFIAIMSYKNLDRQLKLGRTILFIYLLSLVGVLVLAFIGDSYVGMENATREMGLGFYLFVAGFPFIFLANLGIKRDKKLLDSLDRLR